MSVLEFALPDLPGIAKDLFSDRCVVAITPADDDRDWTAGAAWSIARAAAATGRRTALIDLDFENPSLHTQARDPKDIGIVDAFLFGASLQHVASLEEDPNLHFIGVGTPPLDPEEVWASDRWQRLSRGFGKEEAILLLFLPPAALEPLSLAPDLIMAVSRRGFGSGEPRSPHLRSAVDRGVHLAVVRDPPEPALADRAAGATDSVPPSGQPTETTDRRSSLRRRILLSVFGVVVVVAAVVFVLLMSDKNAVQPPDDAAPAAADPLPTALTDSTRQETEALPDRPPPLTTVDSLHYSIQVAAWTQLSQAYEHLAQFHGAGVAATITAVSRDSTRLWYRVFVGAVSDYGAANELRRRLRADGLIGSTSGVLLNTPFALLLATHPDTLSGREAVRGLRESGIPAYIVSMPDGSVQVLVGAFESPDQAELTESFFPEAGRDLSRILVSRVGIAR